MGTPEFASVILKALCESDHEVELVVTQPDRARDRGKKIQITPVKGNSLILRHTCDPAGKNKNRRKSYRNS